MSERVPDRNRSQATKWSRSIARMAWEDKVILGVLVLGFVGAPILHLTSQTPPILVSILVGSAVAALVYRFLGGISGDVTFVIGGLKLTGTLAALVGVTFLVNHALELQSASRMVVEGTFRNLARLGAAECGSGEPCQSFLAHNLEPVDRQMRLYAQEDYDESDLDHYNLEWALVARPTTDVLKWEFQQSYRLPVTSELVDPLVTLRAEQNTMRDILLIPLELLEGRLDQVLTVRYVQSREDPFRNLGRFVADLTTPPTKLRWESEVMDELRTADLGSRPAPFFESPPKRTSGFLSRAAWAQPEQGSSVFDRLDDPEGRRAIHEFLGSPDLKRQLIARRHLLSHGAETLAFIERSLEEPWMGSYNRGILLQNFAEIVDRFAERGIQASESLCSSLATELYLEGAYDDAVRLFDRVSASDDPVRELRRGIALYQTQRYDGAVEAFERSVEVGAEPPVLVAAHRNLGAAYERTGAEGRALDAYRAVLNLEPDDRRARAKVEELEGWAAPTRGVARASDDQAFWVFVGVWRPPEGFETVYFSGSEPPASGLRIRALDRVYRRTEAPSAENGWRQGERIGVVAPGALLEVLETRRSGPDNEKVWAKVVPVEH